MLAHGPRQTTLQVNPTLEIQRFREVKAVGSLARLPERGKCMNWFRALIVVAALLGSTSQALACLCEGTLEGMIADADAIFAGAVVAADSTVPGYVTVTISVSEIWKGPESNSFEVVTPTHSCGVEFFPGMEYLVLAEFVETISGYGTHLCNGTLRLSSAQEFLDLLGEPGWVSVNARTWGSLKSLYY